MQHAVLDRRPGRTGVNEHHNIRAGVVVVGVPRRRGGDMGSNRPCLDIGLDVDELDGLRGEIDVLSIPTLAFQSKQPISKARIGAMRRRRVESRK